MSTMEEELMRKLFPSKSLDAEIIQRDLLQPLEALSESMIGVKERLAQRVALVLGLADIAETQKRQMEELQRFLDGLTEQDDVAGSLDALTDKVAMLIVDIRGFIEGANANVVLEESVLVKLGAYLDKVNG